ncbi:Arm DNA-binding domain-containing protein [Enterobacter quasiroggenkampii]|nr:Arm DNA-binding domain-containing protein [Enterobacter quasiroggenkampii]MCU6338233.1 Arm DNA-binding domain-containing protein [Enterobacter quasiroggenkampii]MCU6389273.1 Arm DNA-binding domain-containing protein [Enterobacter quasiroggenkampii]MCU6399941.1 Arm DNA-binding domain-containing protein [Enterobacter quasiroggenkampii]MCU6410275.1 Arm DNA-binding domain-containing protein [Enterobacter quasiroggenkampii]
MVSEVLPTRQKIWRFRNSFYNKSQKIVLDKYPTVSIAETRLWLEKYCSLDSHGVSPAQKSRKKAKIQRPNDSQAFAKRFLKDNIEKNSHEPYNITRVIEKDIISIIWKLEAKKLTTVH